jgi:hypothetical protein
VLQTGIGLSRSKSFWGLLYIEPLAGKMGGMQSGVRRAGRWQANGDSSPSRTIQYWSPVASNAMNAACVTGGSFSRGRCQLEVVRDFVSSNGTWLQPLASRFEKLMTTRAYHSAGSPSSACDHLIAFVLRDICHFKRLALDELNTLRQQGGRAQSIEAKPSRHHHCRADQQNPCRYTMTRAIFCMKQ